MSEEANVALVRRIFDEWARGSYANVSWADPEIEFEIADGPDRGTYRGLGEMNRAFSNWLKAFAEFAVEPTSFEGSGDHVLVEVAFHGQGKTSGVPLDALRGANLFVVRNGRVARLELHLDRERARGRFEPT